MPTKQLEALAKQAGKTIKEAEECWSKAKERTSKKLQESDDEYWPRVVILTEMCLKTKGSKK